ncbi:MAG TPA: histone deacetylase family protein, partial [Kiloniellales bacterium]|nr:histone deacetylase family protein [Kiloniellales bacterium]
GTQDIFYDRDDVLFVSLHGHPDQEYPYFAGFAEERGRGKGEGYNLNYPMPWGTKWDRYKEALADAIDKVRAFKPDVLVVSLGVDTFEKDPISRFKLTTEAYPEMGRMIATLKLPTLFVMEGGYAVEEIGINAVGVLEGFEGA